MGEGEDKDCRGERDAARAEAAALQKNSNVLKVGQQQKQLKAAGNRFNTKKEELKKQTQLSVDYASQLKAVSSLIRDPPSPTCVAELPLAAAPASITAAGAEAYEKKIASLQEKLTATRALVGCYK